MSQPPPNYKAQQELLRAQLMRAQALQRPEQYRYKTGLGAALGGAGNALRAGFGASREAMLAEALSKSVGDQTAAEAAAKAALDDPNSPLSLKLRPQIQARLGEYATPDILSLVTPNNADELVKSTMDRAGLTMRKEEAAATREATATERTLGREFQERMAGGKQAADAQLERDRRQFELGRDAARREHDVEMEKLRGQTRQEAKAEDAAKGTEIVGLERIPGAAPTADDAKKLKDAIRAREEMRGTISKLRDLHAKYGTELTGPGAVEMKQLVTALGLSGKTIAELGALSGPDQALMDSIVGADPTTVESNAKAFFGVDNTEAALKGLEGWVDNRVNAGMKAFGYRPQTQPQRVPAPVGPDGTMSLGAQPAPAAAPAVGETKKVGARTFRRTGPGPNDWAEVTGG